MKTVHIQRASGHYEGWIDTEAGRAEYRWPTVARIRRWLKLYKVAPVILDYASLNELENAFEP